MVSNLLFWNLIRAWLLLCFWVVKVGVWPCSLVLFWRGCVLCILVFPGCFWLLLFLRWFDGYWFFEVGLCVFGVL